MDKNVKPTINNNWKIWWIRPNKYVMLASQSNLPIITYSFLITNNNWSNQIFTNYTQSECKHPQSSNKEIINRPSPSSALFIDDTFLYADSFLACLVQICAPCSAMFSAACCDNQHVVPAWHANLSAAQRASIN